MASSSRTPRSGAWAMRDTVTQETHRVRAVQPGGAVGKAVSRTGSDGVLTTTADRVRHYYDANTWKFLTQRDPTRHPS